MLFEPWKNPSGTKPGFSLICNGSQAIPHELRMYLGGFRLDAPFLPPSKSSDSPSKTRAASLLARVRSRVEERGSV